MRYSKCTLKASTVHAYAQRLLQQTLELENYQPVLPIKVVASVLILAACWQTSLTGACRLVNDNPSHRQVREVVYACLPPRPRDLLARLLAALRQTLPDHLNVAPQVIAIDLHQRPYYGNGRTKGCTRRQKKKSTHKSFTYATAAVVGRWERYTIGLLPIRPHMRWTTQIEELLRQIEQGGLSIAYLMLDKDYYSAELIALLQKRGVPFLMPAVKTSRKGGGNAWLFKRDCPVGWYSYTWVAPLRRLDFKTMKRHKKGKLAVTVQMCVARGAKDGETVALVYATWGLGRGWSPAEVVAAYKRRFSIEASYRQMEQCLAATSSRNERYRLLLVGLALLLCNLWSYLHAEVFAHGPIGARQPHQEAMRLNDLIAAVAAAIAESLGGWLSQWPTHLPLPPSLAALQT